MLNHSKLPTHDDRIFGNRRAIVVDNRDELEAGRVKIRVPSIHGDEVPDEALPWAIYSDPFMGGMEDIGGFLVPDIGSKIWVFFENGDHDQPVYFAGAPSKPHMPKEKTDGQYPKNKVFKTKAGFLIEIDDTDGETRFHIKQPSGNDKLSDNDGNVQENIKGTRFTHVEGEEVLLSNGKLTIATENGNEIVFDDDGSVNLKVAEKFSVQNGTGELLDWISQFMDILDGATVNTVYGQSPIIESPQIAELKTLLDSMKK